MSVEGAEIVFKVDGVDSKLSVFTTRPDTIFGATYMVLAPEHELLPELTNPEKRDLVEDDVKDAANKSDLERTDLQTTKSGVFTGDLGFLD